MLNFVEVGRQIKIERIKHELSQEQLSEMTKISVSHLSSIERGKIKPSLLSFYKIANALKASTDALLCYSIDNEVSKAGLTSYVATLIGDCSQNELVVIEAIVKAAKDSLRKASIQEGY